jgi:flagellin
MKVHGNLTAIQQRRMVSMQRLSSGKRINSAKDDAAGLSISQRMKNQISGIGVAIRNVQDAISLIQTAEGALSEQHTILNRIRDLTVQAANDSYTEEERENIQVEVNALLEELDRIAQTTHFNTNSLLSDEGINQFTFQVGPNAGDTMTVTIRSMSTASLGLDGFDITKAVNKIDEEGNESQVTFGDLLKMVDQAVSSVSKERASLGATQNVMGHRINSLITQRENLAEANSRIEDVDMAEEMIQLTKDNILYQASIAMLAQANQMPQLLLKLLE